MSDKLTLRELASLFRNAGAKLRALESVADEVTAIAVEDVQTRMDQGIRPDGTEQEPLKNPRPSGNTGPRNVDYGYLQRSVVAELNGTVLTITATRAGARKNQHEHPFLGLSSKARKKIRAAIFRQVMRAFRKES